MAQKTKMIQSIINNSDGFSERNGILVSQEVKNISYPSEGNEVCFQVEENSFWFKHRNNCILEVVKRFAPDKTFVDIGGGNGFTLKALQDDGLETLLIEPGIGGCINARNRGLKNIICSTLEDAPLKEHSVSAMGFFDVIEHIEKDLLFLIQANKYLADNGFIFITVPAYNFLWSKEDSEGGHYRRYTLSKLKKLLRMAGYSVKYSTYIFSILPLPIFLTRTIPSWFGLGKNIHNAQKVKSEHTGGNFLSSIWNKEIQMIKAGKKIPFGGSCLIVAQVNSQP